MSRFRAEVASLTTFDFSGADWRDALRGAVVAALVTAIPVVNGDPETAIPLSIGAVFAAVAEAGQPFGHRWRTMLWTTATMMAASFVAAGISDLPLLAVIVTIPVALVCGFAGAFGRRAAVGGLLSLVIFAIYAGVPVPMDDAPTTAALIGLGGLAQTAVTVTMGILRSQHRRATQESSAPKPWREHLNNPTFLGHAIRLSVVMTLATAISESVDIPHPYWLPMSVAWMSKPDHDGTVDRVVHRLVGTALGLGIAALGVLVFDLSVDSLLVLSILGAAITIAFIWANYAVAVTGVTIWVVSLFAMVGDPILPTIDVRMAATVGAALLVLAAAWLSRPIAFGRRGL